MPADDPARFHGAQIQGRRARQEDAFAVRFVGTDARLALVADGLGGHPAGDRASSEALKTFEEDFLARLDGEGTPGEWLRDALLAANRRLVQIQQDDVRLAGMATTLVAAYVRDDRLSAVSVGDSYLLVFRGGRLARLNTLHSVDGGITSAIGFNLTQMDLANGLELESGDRLLLATDGINVLPEGELTRILADAEGAEDAVDSILAAIENHENPHQDNATVVALFV